jgi:hypothetical protein
MMVSNQCRINLRLSPSQCGERITGWTVSNLSGFVDRLKEPMEGGVDVPQYRECSLLAGCHWLSS